MTRDEGSFSSTDGTSLFYRQTRLENAEAAIVVVHGLGEHGGRYTRLEEALVSNGFSFYVFDQRGHGRSAGPRVYVGSFDDYVDDLNEFINKVRSQDKETPIIVFGHSMGSLTTILYSLKHPTKFSSLVLSSPAFKPFIPFFTVKFAIEKFLSLLFPSIRVDSGIQSSQLSHDPEIRQNFELDPLIERQVTLRWGLAFFQAVAQIWEKATQVTHPLLILQGEADTITDPKGAKHFYESCGSHEKSYETYPGLFHELHNETGSDSQKYFKDLITWISTRTKK